MQLTVHKEPKVKRDRNAPVTIQGQLPRREYISLEYLRICQEILAERISELSREFEPVLQEAHLSLPSYEALIELMRESSDDQAIFRRDASRMVERSIIPELRELLSRLQELFDQNVSLGDQLADVHDANWHASLEAEQSHVATIVTEITGHWQTIENVERRFLQLREQVNRAHRNRASLYQVIAGERKLNFPGVFDRYSELLVSYEGTKQGFQEAKTELARYASDPQPASPDPADAEELKGALIDHYLNADSGLRHLRQHLAKARRDLGQLDSLDQEINGLILEARQLLTELSLTQAELERSLPPPLRTICLKTAAIDETRLAEVNRYSIGELYQSAPSPPGLPETTGYLSRQEQIVKQMEVDVYLLCDINPLPHLEEPADQRLLRLAFTCLAILEQSRTSPGRQPSRICQALAQLDLLPFTGEQATQRLLELLQNAGTAVISREPRGFGNEPFYRLSPIGLELCRRWQGSDSPPLTEEAIVAIRSFFGETK